MEPEASGMVVQQLTMQVGTNIIDYVTIANPGNATDFGDLTESMGMNSQGASNGCKRGKNGW